MGIASAPGTDFVQPLIGDRDLQRSGLIGDRKKEATPKRLGNIDVKTDTGKLTLRTIKGNVIYFKVVANIFKQLFEGFLLP